MLDGIYLKNYRLFKELEISGFKRINLIVGKNNVGKSTLLEGVYATTWQAGFISFMQLRLSLRNDWESFERDGVLDSLREFFYGRELPYGEDNAMRIGLSLEKTTKYYLSTKTTLSFTEYEEDVFVIDEGDLPREIIFENFKGYKKGQFNLGSNFLGHHRLNSQSWEKLYKAWSKIVLTEKEDDIVSALQIIEPALQRIAFLDFKDGKKVMAKLGDVAMPVSLFSMGDGLLQILQIIFNMVNCQDDIFLVDEIENGLHWSVQVDLWRMIFHLSKKLNIQVFASSHSRDTLWALQKAADLQNMRDEMSVIKLNKGRKTGNITAEVFPPDEILVALEEDIELR